MDPRLKNAYLALKGGVLNLEGSSMEPVLREGDRIKVEPVPPNDLKTGDIVVFFSAKKEKPVCHRIICACKSGGEKFFLEKGDNSDRIGIVSEYDILGKVAYVVDNGKPRFLDQDYRVNKFLSPAFAVLVILYKRVSEPVKRVFFPGGNNRFIIFFGRAVWKMWAFIAGLITRRQEQGKC